MFTFPPQMCPAPSSGAARTVIFGATNHCITRRARRTLCGVRIALRALHIVLHAPLHCAHRTLPRPQATGGEGNARCGAVRVWRGGHPCIRALCCSSAPPVVATTAIALVRAWRPPLWYPYLLGYRVPASLKNPEASENSMTKGAYRALCEKLAVLHHREFGKFRRLKGRH